MWWETLIDKGTGIFKTWVDYDSAKQEAAAAQNYSLVTSANAAEAQSGTSDFFGVPPIVILGGAILAGFLILRK